MSTYDYPYQELADDDLDFGESPFEKWAKRKGVANPWGEKYDELASEYFGDDDAVDAFRPGGSPSRSKADPAPDWGTAWEAHLAGHGKDELEMDVFEVRARALKFDETFTKQRIDEGRLDGAEARAARQVNQRIASLRKTLDSAEHAKHTPEYGEAVMELDKLKHEREVAVLLAPYEGKSRDAIRQLGRDHNQRAEELLERYEALDPKKFPERRRSLLRQMIGERLSVAHAEIAGKLLHTREQWAAVQRVEQEYEQTVAHLTKVVDALKGEVSRIEGILRDPKLDGGARLGHQADLEAAKKKLAGYELELQQARTEGSGRKALAAAQAVK